MKLEAKCEMKIFSKNILGGGGGGGGGRGDLRLVLVIIPLGMWICINSQSQLASKLFSFF